LIRNILLSELTPLAVLFTPASQPQKFNTMADLLAEVKKRLTSEDEVSRKLFQRELHETIASAETPKETAIRL
jgi:hypothetical protein